MKEYFEDKGGGIFSPIISPIINIAKGFVSLGEMAGTLVKLVIDVIKMIPSIFDPDKLLNGVIYGTINGLTNMFKALFGKLNNNIGGEENKEDGNGGVFGIENPNKSVCIKPTIINLILLVICPPLALYINKGWTHFFMIIICGLMTYYMYYFPGFLFAALHILC